MKRTLSLTTLALATAAGVLLPAAPATAYVSDPVTLKVGQTLTMDRPPIDGVSTKFQVASRDILFESPALANTATAQDCADEQTGCEVIPVSFPVPDEEDPDAIEAAGYILEVEVSWDSGQTVENINEIGDVRQNRLEAYIFQDPPARNANGTPSYTQNSNNANPAIMTAVNPTSNKFKIVVANMHGVNEGYKLRLSLADKKSIAFDPDKFKPDAPTPGGDFVQPTPPEFPPQDSGFGGAVAPPLSPSAPTTPGSAPVLALPIVVPNIADGRADGKLLTMSRATITSGLGKTGAVNVVSKVAAAQVDNSGAKAVTLGLLVLPILSLVLAFALLARRRKGQQAPAAA